GDRATPRWWRCSRRSSTSSGRRTGRSRMKERLLAALAEVQDPEMPVNLVDLGLVYGVQESGGRVIVDITFKAMGCHDSVFILSDVRERLLAEPGVQEVEV